MSKSAKPIEFERLYSAVRVGDLSAASAFFEEYDRDKILDHLGASTANPLLHYVLETYDFNMIKLLLDYGLDPNQVAASPSGGVMPALNVAVKYGDAKIVELLLNKGAAPNQTAKSPAGEIMPALHMAIIRSNIPIVKLILENPYTDPNIIFVSKTGEQIPALYKAIQMENLDAVKLLLENKANPDLMMTSSLGDRIPPLYHAVDIGSYALVELLLQFHASPSLYGKSNGGEQIPVLYHAVRQGNFGIVKLLLEKGANPNAMATSPTEEYFSVLSMAIEKKNPEIVKLLLQHNTTIEAPLKSATAKLLAANKDDITSCQILFEQNLLSLLCEKEQRNTLKKLVDNGYESAKEAYGEYLFHSTSPSYEEALLYLTPGSKEAILAAFIIRENLSHNNYETINSWLELLDIDREYNKTEYNGIVEGKHTLYKTAQIAQKLKSTEVINEVQADNINKILKLHKIGGKISELERSIIKLGSQLTKSKASLEEAVRIIQEKIDILALELEANPSTNLHTHKQELLVAASRINGKLATKKLKLNLDILDPKTTTALDSDEASAYCPSKASRGPDSESESGVSSRKCFNIHEGLLREYADASTRIKGYIESDTGLTIGSNSSLAKKLKAFKDSHTGKQEGLVADVLYAINKKISAKFIISFLEKLGTLDASIIIKELADEDTGTVVSALTFDGAATANLSVSAEDLGDNPCDIANEDDAVEDVVSEEESSDSEEASAAAAATPSLTKKEKGIFRRILSQDEKLKVIEIKKLIDKLATMGESLECKPTASGYIIIDQEACKEHVMDGKAGLSGAANLHTQHSKGRTTDDVHPAFLNVLADLLKPYAMEYLYAEQDFEAELGGAGMYHIAD